jgi:thiol-disulfide isomerase/thioredoxin
MDICLQYGERPLCIPWDGIDRVTRVQSKALPDADKETEQPIAGPGFPMRLLTENVVSTGNVDSVHPTEAGHRTLAWLPVHGSIPSPIHPQTSGAIEPLGTLPQVAAKKKPSSVPLAVIRADVPRPEPILSRELHPDDPSLFLVSGDCFPGKVMAGDEENVVFQSPLFEKTDVPASQVRGMRIVDFQGADALDRATRSRLLTLPRVQRKNPPTHLVVARDGDLLRGRLMSFNRDELTMEVRGEERTLTMKNVAEIIWLEPAPPAAPPEPDSSPSDDTVTADTSNDPSGGDMDGLYQVILDQGARVSISPESVTRETLSGEHPVLGKCTLPWEKVNRLVLGNSIRLDASRNRFGKWKLQNAADPKFVNEGSEQNDAPSDTALDRLIGQQAAEQDLLKLDGTPFRISDYRGQILILDFWASWCGPCLQGMPRIHQISREYQDAGVEVVFVNLEETEDRIRMLLERLEITPTIALDVDGSFSKQYAVQAIPQTVVIDRDGTIIKIFVGSGDETEANLIRLLNDLTKS